MKRLYVPYLLWYMLWSSFRVPWHHRIQFRYLVFKSYCTLSDLPPGAVRIGMDDLYDITNLSIQRWYTWRTGNPKIVSDDQHFWQTCKKKKMWQKSNIGTIPITCSWSYFACCICVHNSKENIFDLLHFWKVLILADISPFSTTWLHLTWLNSQFSQSANNSQGKQIKSNSFSNWIH